MSERQGFVIRNGFLATGALAILVLLMVFYSTVSGAVDRAARQRADGSGAARAAATSALPLQIRNVASVGRSGS